MAKAKTLYAMQAGEDDIAYCDRIKQLDKQDNSKGAIAARILVTAIDLSLYSPSGNNSNNVLAQAFDKIAASLAQYDAALTTTNDPSVDNTIVKNAMKKVQESYRLSQRIINRLEKKARAVVNNDGARELADGLTAAWREIKIVEGFEPDDNTAPATIIKGFKDKQDNGRLVDTDISKLVERIHDLRQQCRNSQKR